MVVENGDLAALLGDRLRERAIGRAYAREFRHVLAAIVDVVGQVVVNRLAVVGGKRMAAAAAVERGNTGGTRAGVGRADRAVRRNHVVGIRVGALGGGIGIRILVGEHLLVVTLVGAAFEVGDVVGGAPRFVGGIGRVRT